MSEPHSAQHGPSPGDINMLAPRQEELLPVALQVVNHGTSTSLNAAPVTQHAETHKIDPDFFTTPAKLWCPANRSRTNQLAASSSVEELSPAADTSACRWCAASFSHLVSCHPAELPVACATKWCQPSFANLCVIHGFKTASAA